MCRYTAEGKCDGDADPNTPNPIRLEWDISEQVREFAYVVLKDAFDMFDCPTWYDTSI